MTPTQFIVTDRDGQATKVQADDWLVEDDLITFLSGEDRVAAFHMSQFHSLKAEQQQGVNLTYSRETPKRIREYLEEDARKGSGNR